MIIEDIAGNPSGGTRTNSLTEDGRTLAGYMTVNLSGSYTIAQKKWGFSDWKAFAIIKNLFNDPYQEKYGFPEPGITFRLGSKASF
ncbi:MAG: TonB-dependent receptor [Deltaproteobacteria bacterium]|nr:MAG: TonB-dependent receptor [Deltaproteobacteria bacterium]